VFCHSMPFREKSDRPDAAGHFSGKGPGAQNAEKRKGDYGLSMIVVMRVFAHIREKTRKNLTKRAKMSIIWLLCCEPCTRGGAVLMLAAERRNAIVELAAEHGVVHVPNLSERFAVSASTIRRDLEQLAASGQLRRTHGGAIAIVPQDEVIDISEVEFRIGQAAADFIRPGETVFLGTGSLCNVTARCLRNRSDLTIITNGLQVAWTLFEASNLTLILTGGPVVRPSGGMVGQGALQALNQLRADRLVLEVAGVSPIEGLTSDQVTQAEVLRVLVESVAEVIVLVTPERLGRVGPAWLGAISDADVIITGREASTAIAWDLTETGVKVTLV
jgi:DeoR/GlpR family transcriptional regulator of sugar metabolism